jgi:hypothetical protein
VDIPQADTSRVGPETRSLRWWLRFRRKRKNVLRPSADQTYLSPFTSKIGSSGDQPPIHDTRIFETARPVENNCVRKRADKATSAYE